MGWSLPDIPASSEVRPWSPWVCLFIIFSGVFVALVQVVLHSPAGGLPSLASGYWLPLTGFTLAGITIALTGYLLWWEVQAYRCWRWNNWRCNTQLAWQQMAHQHRCVGGHVLLTADAQLLPRLAGAVPENSDEAPLLTIATEKALVPGITRFEQLSQLLIEHIKPAMLSRYPSGPLTVLVQTSAQDKEREREAFSRLWSDARLPWTADIQVSAEDALPADDWNALLSSTKTPLLVLAMHYRQPEETRPEFACALLLVSPAQLKPSEQRDAIRLFRAMPLNTGAFARELAELRDMAQQPASIKHVVWHSGLAQVSQQALRRVVNDLPLPLHADIAAGGMVDTDKACANYGSLNSWLMAAMATEMVRFGPGSHWLIQADKTRASAMIIGNRHPVIRPDYLEVLHPPYPAGPLMLAMLLNGMVFWFVGKTCPEWLFSWAGVVTLLLSLAMTLPGAVFGLRNIIAYRLRPRFIQTAGCPRKE